MAEVAGELFADPVLTSTGCPPRMPWEGFVCRMKFPSGPCTSWRG